VGTSGLSRDAIPNPAGRKFYGTLFDVPDTATHVVCPICGKSSSLKTFPAGRGTDILLQTYQGLGRGKVFSVVSRESGIDDPVLALALKPKLLDLLSVLSAHGHITSNDIANSAGGGGGTQPVNAALAGDEEPDSTKGRPTAGTKTRAAVEAEVAEVRVDLMRLLGQWRDAERREAFAQRRFDEIREHTDRLVAETRRGIESMQRLQAEMGAANRATKELAELARGMNAIVEDVQALRASQQPRRPYHDGR